VGRVAWCSVELEECARKKGKRLSKLFDSSHASKARFSPGLLDVLRRATRGTLAPSSDASRARERAKIRTKPHLRGHFLDIHSSTKVSYRPCFEPHHRQGLVDQERRERGKERGKDRTLVSQISRRYSSCLQSSCHSATGRMRERHVTFFAPTGTPQRKHSDPSI